MYFKIILTVKIKYFHSFIQELSGSFLQNFKANQSICFIKVYRNSKIIGKMPPLRYVPIFKKNNLPAFKFDNKYFVNA